MFRWSLPGGACTWCLMLIAINALSQRVQINTGGGYKHNYVVGAVDYLEDYADTARLFHVGTLWLTDRRNQQLQVAPWYETVQIKAKQAGSNMVKVIWFREDSLQTSLCVRLYFAPEKILKANKAKALQTSMIIFNELRLPRDSGFFYLNDSVVKFDSRRFYQRSLALGRQYQIRNNTGALSARKNILYRKPGRAGFYIVPVNKKTAVSIDPLLTLSPVLIGGVAVNFENNPIYGLRYDVGRFMMDVYR